MKKIKIPKIFDAHVHFREGKMLKSVFPYIAKYCRYAVAMGNLQNSPITNWGQVANYYQKIMDIAFSKKLVNFEPIMTVMLTYNMTPEILEFSHKNGARILKLIPGQTSTGSDQGLALWDLYSHYHILKKAMELGMIFSIHCESVINPETREKIHLVNQEKEGIPYFDQIIKDFPELKIIFEHVSSKELCKYFLETDHSNIGATITGHHPFITYDQVCDANGKIIDPLLYCKPIAKFKEDVEAIRNLMLSGHPRVFFGSDFAPHPWGDKNHKHAAGIANIPEVAIPTLWELFLEKFHTKEAQQKFENFTSDNALRFYGLPEYKETLTLKQKRWKVSQQIKGGVKIFRGGETLNWKIIEY